MFKVLRRDFTGLSLSSKVLLGNNVAQGPVGEKNNLPYQSGSRCADSKNLLLQGLWHKVNTGISGVLFTFPCSKAETSTDSPCLSNYHLLILYTRWGSSVTASSADADLHLQNPHSKRVIAVGFCSCLCFVVHLAMCDIQRHSVFQLYPYGLWEGAAYRI